MTVDKGTKVVYKRTYLTNGVYSFLEKKKKKKNGSTQIWVKSIRETDMSPMPGAWRYNV